MRRPAGGWLDQTFRGDYEAFFRQYDAFRYSREGHILGCLDGIDFRGAKLLEIGFGQGADAEQIIRRGARWSGLDLTAESVARLRTRLQLRGLPYDELKQGSALAIPYPDNTSARCSVTGCCTISPTSGWPNARSPVC
jgi:ubiquinone/menaquinone biosynthesis C-methylase UbiE